MDKYGFWTLCTLFSAGGIYLVYLFGKQFCKNRRSSLKESNDNEESLIEKIGISSEVINDKDLDSLHSQDCFLKTDIPKSDSNQSQSDRDNIHLHDSSLKTNISKPVSNQSQSQGDIGNINGYSDNKPKAVKEYQSIFDEGYNIQNLSNFQARKSKIYKEPAIRPPSLTNVGANCYLNAAIQGISSCNKFVNDIKDLHLRKDLHCNDNLDKLFIFQTLINILNGGSISRLEISRNSIFENWNKPGQQDSYELLAYVMNQVYNDIRKHLETQKLISRSIQDWLKIPLPLRILIEYNIKCGCGLIVEAPLQSDLALHVPMSANTRKNLQSLVDGFFKNDIIEDYICDKKSCDGKGATRQTKLRLPLPKTICIHLQRTFWNGNKMLKIGTRINFDKNLIIKAKYCSTKQNQKFEKKLITEQVQYIENSSSENHNALASVELPDITNEVKANIIAIEGDQNFEGNDNLPYSNSVEKSVSILEIAGHERKPNLIQNSLSENNNVSAPEDSSDSVKKDETNSSSESNNALSCVDSSDSVKKDETNSSSENHNAFVSVELLDVTNEVKANIIANEGDQNFEGNDNLPYSNSVENSDSILEIAGHERKPNLIQNSLSENNNVCACVDSSYSVNRDETNSSSENHNAFASMELPDITNEVKANIIANEGDQNFEGNDNLPYSNSVENSVSVLEIAGHERKPNLIQNSLSENNNVCASGDSSDSGKKDETNSSLENNNALACVDSSDSVNRDETNSSSENHNAFASVELPDITNEVKANIIANEDDQNFDGKDNLSHANNEEKTVPISEPNQIHTNDREKLSIKTNSETEKLPDIKPNTFPERSNHCISLDAETTVNNDDANMKFEGYLDSSNSKDESMHNDEIEDKKYVLCSVIVHYGSVYGGHYVCYKLVDNRWFLTDDSRIKEVTKEEVFGCEAYILFYEEL